MIIGAGFGVIDVVGGGGSSPDGLERLKRVGADFTVGPGEAAMIDATARLEGSALPGRIQCSEAFAAIVARQAPEVRLALR